MSESDRIKRTPIPAEGEGERIEQAGLDYANGIRITQSFGATPITYGSEVHDSSGVSVAGEHVPYDVIEQE